MQLVGRILKIQTLVAVLLAGLGVLFISWPFGMSALVGGLIAAIPQLIFGLWAFRVRGARNARRITQNVFVGEALKLVTTVLALIAVWTSIPWLDATGVFAGFLTTIGMLQVTLPWMLGNTRTY